MQNRYETENWKATLLSRVYQPEKQSTYAFIDVLKLELVGYN